MFIQVYRETIAQAISIWILQLSKNTFFKAEKS